MADTAAVAAIGGVGEKTGMSASLGSYQRWLADNGQMPWDRYLRQHPNDIAAGLVGEASRVSARFDRVKARTVDLFSSVDLGVLQRSEVMPAGTVTQPGSAQAPAGSDPAAVVAAGEMQPSASDKGPLGAAAQAVEMMHKASAAAIEAQWKQTVVLVEHDLSMMVLSSSIQSSISTAKEFQEGLNSLMRA